LKQSHNSDQKDDDFTIFQLSQTAHSIYHSINAVVNLTQNMRHTINSTSASWFPAMLSRLRYGEFTSEDLAKLNEVCYEPYLTEPLIPVESLQNPFDNFCPFVVSSHVLRIELNNQMMNLWASTTKTPLYEFDALVHQNGMLLRKNKRKSLNHLWENKTRGLPMINRLGLGMPMICTVNMSPHLKLCNGSIGHVVYIKHHESNTMKSIADGNLFVQKCSHIPEYVLLKLWKVDQEFFPGLGAGVVLVKPFIRNSVTVKLPPNRSFDLKIKQIPLIPAFSLLIEKVQGLTLNSVIIGPMRHSTRMNPQRTSMHVSTSRIKDPYFMRLAQPLTMEDIIYFRPPAHLIIETKRLEAMEIPDDYDE
jgi:hypothetical protein